MATYNTPWGPKPIVPVQPGRRVVTKPRQQQLSRMLARGKLSPAHKLRVQEELWGQGQFSWAPPTPEQLPFGTYDVGLDAQQRAAQRGLGYTGEDIGSQLARLREDFAAGQEDIGKGRTRSTEDYTRNVGQLQRNYDVLRGGQLQNMRQAGGSGGAYQQSQTKRAANQAWEKAPIDTGYARQGQDFDTALARLTQSFGRGETDLNTQLRRAQIEGPAFDYDIGQAKLAQAKQYDPGLFNPPPPRGVQGRRRRKRRRR